MTAPSRRPGVLRVAGSTLLLTCLLLGLGSLMSSPANAAPTPTPTPGAPGAPGSPLGSGLIFDPLNPAVEPVTPTDPLAVFTQGPPPTFPFTTTTAPLSLGTVPVATTLSMAPSIPPAPVGSNGCLNLGAAAGPLQIAAPCDSPGGQAITAVVNVVSFAQDPLGWLTDKMGQGASGVMSWVADTANNATAADLTAPGGSTPTRRRSRSRSSCSGCSPCGTCPSWGAEDRPGGVRRHHHHQVVGVFRWGDFRTAVGEVLHRGRWDLVAG